MNIIRNNSENLLLAAIAEVRQKKHVWWAVWIHLSCSGLPVGEVILKVLSDTVRDLSSYGEWSIYFIDNGDAVLLTKHIPTTLCEKTVNQISFTLVNELSKGIDLCSVYKTSDDLFALQKGILEAQRSKPKPQTQGVPDVALLLNPDFFKLSVMRRKERKRLCILIAEDQSFSRQLVTEILGSGYEKIIASDGVEALRLYEAHAPNLVFLDIDMPCINGQAVLERITSVDKDSFVVMLTASQLLQDVEHSLKSGAMGYITKPFSKQKIDKYLRLHNQMMS